jgi:ribose transport system substrate-binding protein
MNPTGRNVAAASAVTLALSLGLSACSQGDVAATAAAATATGAPSCPSAYTSAQSTVTAAESAGTAWTGPATGPTAAANKTIIYIAQTMTNPGVAGAEAGVAQAAKAIGWNFSVIDGQGTPAGIQAAFSSAIALKPAGIVIGGFDPGSTAAQVAAANAAGITLIGWHALGTPGPSTSPKLFTNITTSVAQVAKLSADWVITQSRGNGGVVVFTDLSIPFAAGKSQLIKNELATCASLKLLSYENIPIADASSRVPQEVSSLESRFGSQWTYSVAINDLYFADGAAALRSAGLSGGGAPYNIGAGDGDPSAFQRIEAKQYEAATVPDPLVQEGWQIVDEFNRSFNGAAASGYVPQPHLTTAQNAGSASSWDPANGYQQAYLKIWGK